MSKFSQFNFGDKKALVRVDFNVPLNENFQITDDTRMRAAIPTIQKVLQDGGSVILMSHFGRPKDGPDKKYSLIHLVPHLQKLLGDEPEVFFSADCIGEAAAHAAALLQKGDVLLMENLRFHKEEEKGDMGFAEQLSKLGDVYINDAFGTAHRAHASTAIVADFFDADKKMFGLLMEGEVSSAEKVLLQSEKPFTAIIGGAKVSDKILIIENLLEKATDIIIGGGMAYTFWKAQGKDIGNSLCEDDRLGLASSLLEMAKAKGEAENPTWSVASFTVNPPKTAEAYWYRTLYTSFFPDMATSVTTPAMWMPRFIHATDPSARTLKNYSA
jgi:phosphoglycerate kinase